MAMADQTSVTQILVNFGKAIAAYEGTLVMGASPFDLWAADLAAGNGDASTQISDQAKAGAKLFVDKAGCSDCHNTPLFSDDQFHNVGVGQTGEGVPKEEDCAAGTICDCTPGTFKNCLPWGARDGIQKLQANGFRRDSVWSDDTTDVAPTAIYTTVNLSTIPLGAYRTPSLRNVGLTAPVHARRIDRHAGGRGVALQPGHPRSGHAGHAGGFVQGALLDRRRAGRAGGLPRVAQLRSAAGGRAGGAHAPLSDRGCGRSLRAPQVVSIFLTSSVKVGLAA